MKCPNCSRQVDALRTAVKNGKYISERCERCLASLNNSAVFARKFERDSQRREYAKDLLQPDDEDYAKIYGAENARERGWSEEELRKFG